jgi:hypothetical protein
MRSFFSPQIIAHLFEIDEPFRIRCSNKMEIYDMQISVALGQHICASSIKIWFEFGMDWDDILHFLCSTAVVPKMVSIGDPFITRSNDRQYLIQVV